MVRFLFASSAAISVEPSRLCCSDSDLEASPDLIDTAELASKSPLESPLASKTRDRTSIRLALLAVWSLAINYYLAQLSLFNTYWALLFLRRATLLLSSSVLGSYLVYGRYKDYKRAREQLASHYELAAYRALPLRNLSRLWGQLNSLQLPTPLRTPILSAYVRAFGCNIEEAENSSLASYPSLGDFFRRALKPDARPIESSGDDDSLCSPCDGLVLSTKCLSETTNPKVENVKGVSFSLPSFFQDDETLSHCASVLDKSHSRNADSDTASTHLYSVTLYLAPGDYHRFHSPANWTIHRRRHVPGELLSVHPSTVSYYGHDAVFAINERVHYVGGWGSDAGRFLAMSPVGATNVGSIGVYFDPSLCTNRKCHDKSVKIARRVRKIGHEILDSSGEVSRYRAFLEGDTVRFEGKERESETGSGPGVALKKGEPFGEFNLGSTIVLTFEAPANSKFLVSPGDRVVMGKTIFSTAV